MKAYEQFISELDVERIHENTLNILANVGVKFESEEVIDIFKSHGVKVDGEIVYIDEKTLLKCMDTVPNSFEMVADIEEKKVNVGRNSMLTCSIRHPAYIARDGKIKTMKSADAIEQFKMSEASKVVNCGFLNFAFLNGVDATEEQRALGQIAFLLKYSNKNKIFADTNVSGFSSENAYRYSKLGIDLVKNFYGIDDGAVMITCINPISPLCYDEIPLNKMAAYLEEGQVCVFTSCSMPLLTSPASVSGMLSTSNAEVLAGIVLSQLIKPGARVVYGNTSGSTDMRTIQLSIGTAEASLVSYATAALADYYNIPFRTGGGLSDGKSLDAQVGSESMMMLRTTYDIKPDLVFHHVGTMGSFNVLSLEKFILDEENAMMIQRQLTGIDTSDEKLCYDEIKDVGPRGKFLRGRTPKMYREEFYLGNLFNKEDPNTWQSSGSNSIYDVAHNEVRKRISTYQAPEITEEQNTLVSKYLPSIYLENI